MPFILYVPIKTQRTHIARAGQMVRIHFPDFGVNLLGIILGGGVTLALYLAQGIGLLVGNSGRVGLHPRSQHLVDGDDGVGWVIRVFLTELGREKACIGLAFGETGVGGVAFRGGVRVHFFG